MATQKSNAGKIVAGVGLTALAAAAAAGYYFAGPNGKKHKKMVSAWSEKAKKDMLAKIKQMKNVTKETYLEASSEILSKYKDIKNIDPSELVELGKELKSHWNNISKDLKKAGSKAVKTIEKNIPAKKVVSKAKTKK